MKLKVGSIGIQPGYKIVLEQEGIPYTIIPFEQEFSSTEYPVLIIDYLLPEYEWNKIVDYVREGGILLINADSYNKIFQEEIKYKKVKYLIPQKNSIYSEIGLIDIYRKISYPKSNTVEPVDKNLYIFAKRLEHGKIFVLPFSVNELIADWSSKRKKFYAKRKELPSEIVATVSKNKIREIVRVSLEHLFHSQNLPFISKWYYPNGNEKAFLFRVDTDFCSQNDAEDFYKICENHGINSTWFVDTESKKRLKNFYSRLSAEVALHCKEHKIFKDYEKNYNNIKSGIADLQDAGIETKGFAAPFGEWNPALAKVLEAYDFEYSSEFTIDYDNLPFYPYYENRFSDVLQIPIHPVSLGRLRRSHFKQEEMLNYYELILQKKNSKFEPVIFYHHPHHRNFSVFDKLFNHVSASDFWNPTFHEFSEWWGRRNQISLDPKYKDGKIFINKDYCDYIKISTDQKKYKILKAKPEIDIDKLVLNKKSLDDYPPDIDKIRDFTWRDLLYNFETWRAKKKR